MKYYKTTLAITIVGIVYLVSMYAYKPYRWFYVQEGGDAFGYYVYLPSFFIHHDLHDLRTTTAAKYSHLTYPKQVPDTCQNKYFAGTAFLQAPFFLAAHALAGPLHQRRDGFSMVYMYAVSLSAIFYVLAALLLIAIILSRYFDDGVIAVVVLILGLATNLYYMVVYQPPFCHAYLFFWYALLLWFTIRYYESLRRRYILLIGWACGMIILTRPNEMYVMLIPILWGLSSREILRHRGLLLKKNAVFILGAGLIMILCILPQLLYWKVSTGHFFYDGYTGEKFDFLRPHIWKGFFSFSNGWLIYCPIMILALGGIWALVRHRHAVLVPLAVFGILHIYIIYSWWCYWYMGSYGSRPMTEMYPLLSIPLAYSVQWLLKGWLRRILLGSMVGICVFIACSHTYQAHLDIFHSDMGNAAYYFTVLGKGKTTYEEYIVSDTEERQPENAVKVKEIMHNDFESGSIAGTDSTVAGSGRRSYHLRPDSVLTLYYGTLAASGAKPGQWIRASAKCMSTQACNDKYRQSAMIITTTTIHDWHRSWHMMRLQSKIENPNHQMWHFSLNTWDTLYFYSRIPRNMKDTDKLNVFIEYGTGKDMYLDDVRVEIYEEK